MGGEVKTKESNSLTERIIAKIYDPGYKWITDLWALKWIALVFIIMEFHQFNTTPISRTKLIFLAEFLFFLYASLSTIFLRNKLSFNVQTFNLLFDFLALTFFQYLSLEMFGAGSRIFVLYLIPVIYCSYWFRRAFTFIFVTLISFTFFILNYSLLLINLDKHFIIPEITGTLVPLIVVYYLVSLLVILFKKKIFKYFVDVDQELEKHAEILEQEKKYTRSLLKDKIDGFIAIDEKGRVTEINKLACELFGYDREEIEKKNVNVKEIYAPGESERMIEELRASPTDTIENFKTFVINKKDKEKIPILVSAAFLYDRNSDFQAELAKGKRFPSLGYFRDLRVDEIIDRIGRKLTYQGKEKTLLTDITKSISKILKAEVCSILIYNGTTGRLEITGASYGITSVSSDPGRREYYNEMEGMAGYVFSTGKTLNVTNIGIHKKKIEIANKNHEHIDVKWRYAENFAANSRYNDLKHFLATPLRIENEVYGVIKVLNKHLNDKELDNHGFQNKDQRFLKRISSQVSVLVEKIRNKERFDALSEIGMELNDKLDIPLDDFLDIVAREVVIKMGFKACLIRLIKGNNKLKIRAFYGIEGNYIGNEKLTLDVGEGTTGEVAKTGFHQVIPDVGENKKTKFKEILKEENLKSMLSVPIKNQNRVMGVISCYTQRKHHFSQEEIQFMQTFTIYTAVAIQNRRRVQELLALNEIGSEIVKPFQIKELFDHILEKAKEISGADRICIKKYDERTGEISTLRCWKCEWHNKYPNHVLKLGEDLISKVIKRDEPKNIPNYDIKTENLETVPDKELFADTKSCMILPIKIYGRVFGVLCLESKRANSFSDDDLLILNAFCNQAATALRTVNFFNKLQDVKETFPKISELSMDIHKLLEEIAKIAADVLETDVLVLYRYDEKTKKIILPLNYTGDIKHKEFIKPEVISSETPLSIMKKGKSYYAEKSQEDPIMISKGKPLPDKIPARFVIREEIVSSAGIILRVAQEIVGVMFINYRTPHDFNEDERQIIEILASYIAIASQNVKHFSEKKVADTMQTIGIIASAFAHKLKNDIGTLNLYTDGLMDDIKPGQPQYYPVSQIKEKILRIVGEINHLQKASKLHIQEKKPTGIKKLIDELKTEILQDLKMKKVKLKTEISPDTPEIEIDPMQIKLVLVNLARNSIEAMPEGGEMSVSVSKSKEHIVIEWTDSGSGIPPEHAAKVFDIFWTSKSKGYGLGLFHAKATVEEHGGSIFLDAAYTNGARFLIELPFQQE